MTWLEEYRKAVAKVFGKYCDHDEKKSEPHTDSTSNNQPPQQDETKWEWNGDMCDA